MVPLLTDREVSRRESRAPAGFGQRTNEPLLVLSEQRLQHEVQRALAVAAATHDQLVRKRWLIAACLLEFAGGLTRMGLGFHVSGEDYGQALFLGGVIVGYLGPVWTWILANWHGGE